MVGAVHEAHERTWSLEADPTEIRRIRGEVGSFVDAHYELSPERRADLALALSEVVTNALLHGNRDGRANPIEVHVHVDGKVEFTVRDAGVGMRPNPTGGGAGYGLAIVSAVADDLQVHDSDLGGTEVRVRFD